MSSKDAVIEKKKKDAVIRNLSHPMEYGVKGSIQREMISLFQGGIRAIYFTKDKSKMHKVSS